MHLIASFCLAFLFLCKVQHSAGTNTSEELFDATKLNIDNAYKETCKELDTFNAICSSGIENKEIRELKLVMADWSEKYRAACYSLNNTIRSHLESFESQFDSILDSIYNDTIDSYNKAHGTKKILGIGIWKTDPHGFSESIHKYFDNSYMSYLEGELNQYDKQWNLNVNAQEPKKPHLLNLVDKTNNVVKVELGNIAEGAKESLDVLNECIQISKKFGDMVKTGETNSQIVYGDQEVKYIPDETAIRKIKKCREVKRIIREQKHDHGSH